MPKVLIGIIANDSARYSLFSACVTQLDREGFDSDLEWLIGGDWCGARNNLVRMTLAGDYTHLWFMDDDHAFHAQMLKQLLSHDVPLVNPLCCTRVAPFQLVTYAGKGEAENMYLPLSLNGEQGTGLVELMAGGCAGMLIRRDVLEAIPAPWFEYTDRSEDIIFCEKAKAAGFSLYADLACRLGHITTAVVYPEIENDRWMTLLNINGLNVYVDTAENMAEDVLPPAPRKLEPMTIEQPSVVDTPVLPLAVETGDLPPSSVDGLTRVTEPCLICGEQATWHDVHGRWGCADHSPEHDGWKTHYERVEIWFKPDENRWYGRVLTADGSIARTPLLDVSYTTEQELLTQIEELFGEISIFQIADEMQDSTRKRWGPARLFDRQPVE